MIAALVRQLFRARKLVRALTTPSYRRGLLHGVAPSIEHESIPFRDDFMTVIDVGASRGQFALFAAEHFPNATLICFEPLPGALERLERLLAPRAASRVVDVALADQRKAATFHVSNADDSSSLLPIGARQREAFPGTGEQSIITVEQRRLDELLQPCDLVHPVLLKIDVQGAELAVLTGAGTLLDSVDAVLVEASFAQLYETQPLVDEVWTFLTGRGFMCRGVWSIAYGRRGDCLQGDFLFSRAGFEPLSLF
jgi:FkbM family methyltransferase